MKKRFLTLCPGIRNFELMKDGGMIAYMLYKTSDYDATIACYGNGEYPALNGEVRGLKIVFMKKIFHNEFLDSIWFLLFNSRKFDIIHMFHWVLLNQLTCFFFKVLKLGNGCAYIKMDAQDEKIKKIKGIKLWVIEKTLSFIDIISVETKGLYNYLNNNTKIKVEYIPNGFYDYGVRQDVRFAEKENIILTVGRIGTVQKASEILLEGFKKFAFTNKIWKLKIVGTIEPDFEKTINDYFKENLDLIERVEFVGPINNKEELKNVYKKAKIFALTSRWEGFPFVNIEAIQSGCFIISTEIPPAYDVTENGKYGMFFSIDDVEGLAKGLVHATASDDFLESKCQPSQDYAYNNFYWPQIISRLDKLIQKTFN